MSCKTKLKHMCILGCATWLPLEVCSSLIETCRVLQLDWGCYGGFVFALQTLFKVTAMLVKYAYIYMTTIMQIVGSLVSSWGETRLSSSTFSQAAISTHPCRETSVCRVRHLGNCFYFPPENWGKLLWQPENNIPGYALL